MLARGKRNSPATKAKRQQSQRETPRSGVLSAELAQSLQRDVSRCNQNLERYKTEIESLILQNKLELEKLRETLTKKLTDLEDSLRQKGESLVDQHLNEEMLLLHKHLQAEGEQPNELLHELRRFTLKNRNRASLSDYYTHTDHVVLDLADIQNQLWEMWQHVLLEHKLCWDNLQLEFQAKIKGHGEEAMTRWSRFKEEREARWKYMQREHEELWHCMSVAQEEWRQENQVPDSFLDFEKQALESYIEKVQTSKVQTTRTELQEMRDAISGQNKQKMQMLVDELKEHWDNMQTEKNFIQQTLLKIWLPDNLETMDESYAKEAKESWDEKVKRVTNLYDNMQRVSRHHEYQSIREGLTTSQRLQSETAKCLDSIKVARLDQWKQKCTRSDDGGVNMAEETRKE